MKRFAVLLSMLALLAGLALPALGKVDATVVDENGKPIAKAKVLVLWMAKTGTEAKFIYSDTKGKVSFNPSSEHYSLTAVAKGRTFGSYYPRGDAKAPIRITLLKDKPFKGRVVDENGKPLAGVTIALEQFSGADKSQHQLGFHAMTSPFSGTPKIPGYVDLRPKAVSGADGYFAILHTPDPSQMAYLSMLISTSKSGKAEIRKTLQMSDMDSELVLTVPPSCKVQGTLYTPNKAALAPDGTILIAFTGDILSVRYARYSRVGKDGTFEFYNLPPGKLSITMHSMRILNQTDHASLDWVLPKYPDIELSAGETRTLELVGAKGSLLKGRVIDKASGSPIAGASVMIDEPGRPNGMGNYLQTDAKGEFSTRVAGGDVSISLNSVPASGRHVGVSPQDVSPVAITAIDGQDQSDIEIKVDVAEVEKRYSANSYEYKPKPIPPDFKLLPGHYALTWDSELDIENGITTFDQEASPTLFKKLPTFASSKPIYKQFTIDGTYEDGSLLAVLDESKGTGRGYDTVYIDSNRNSDLSDDTPSELTLQAGSPVSFSPWVTVDARQGRAQTHPIQVRCSVYSYSKDMFNINMSRKGGWKGAADSSKGKIPIAVIDSNTNGIYNDRSVVKNGEAESEGDCVFADTNGSGSLNFNYESPHRIPLNEAARIGDALYTINVSETGDEVDIAPYSGPTGRLLLRGGNIYGLSSTVGQIRLVGSSGIYSEIGEDGGRGFVLPSGKYKAEYFTLNLKSKQSKSIQLSCRSDAEAEVRPGESTTITIEGKLTSSIDPEKKETVLHSNSSDAIIWSMKLGGSTTVSPPDPGESNSSPKVEFFDNRNKLIATTTAGYT